MSAPNQFVSAPPPMRTLEIAPITPPNSAEIPPESDDSFKVNDHTINIFLRGTPLYLSSRIEK